MIVKLNLTDIELTFIRSPGPGGQNVNKVATAVQLRFNIFNATNLTEEVRSRLTKLHYITQSGDLIIKANRYRTQERNKQDALQRLQHLIDLAVKPIKKRKKTKPTKGSIERRLMQKKLRAKTKSLRRDKF